MEESKTPLLLQYYLGAQDIARIVNAILPVLDKYLPDKTKDEQYVFLTTLVNSLSKDKTYGNKSELDKLVKDIANKVGKRVVTSKPNDLGQCPPNRANKNCNYIYTEDACNNAYSIAFSYNFACSWGVGGDCFQGGTCS